MSLMETILKRRSVREYSGASIPEDSLKKILSAGLLAPTSMNRKPCEFYLVKDRETLKALSEAKAAGGLMLGKADAAIAVFGDSAKADTWIEDCSIALSYMSLMAVEEGVGSCWVQMHLRKKADGSDAEANVRAIFNAPESYRIVGVLALGMPKEEPQAHTSEDADWSKVH